MNEPIYCSKCKKKTDNNNPFTTQTSNGRWRVSAQFLKCKTNKSQFIQKPQEDKLLLANELHKHVTIHLKKRSIITKGIDDLWATDLIDMKKYSEENNYMINVIDTSSKFAWALPIKRKMAPQFRKLFEKIIKTAKSQNHMPRNLLHTDKGLESENKHFKTLLNNYGIHMYHTESGKVCYS